MRRALILLALASCKSHTSQEPPPATTAVKATAAFVDVTLVSMDSDKELEHQTVLVDGTTIVAIGPVASTGVPAQANKIDGKGKWLIPGLIDMHVHYNDERYGTLFVANGVTTVRNMWGFPSVLAMRDKARANDPAHFGPSIYTAGAIVDGDPPTWPGSHVVHNAAEATAEVEAQVKDGYDFIKVYDGVPLDAYDAIAAAAKKANVRFAGHAPKAVSLAHLLEAGQASVEHLTGYSVAALDDTAPAGKPGKSRFLDPDVIAHLDASRLPALAKQTADAHVTNVPTLVVLSRLADFEHPEQLQARPEMKYAPPDLLQTWDPKRDFRTTSWSAQEYMAMHQGNEFRQKVVKALVDAGASILVGTDTPNPFVVPGFSIHEELGMLVAAGLTPYQALRGATSGAAEWIGDKAAGHVAVGSRADLVLLDADPLKDISATTKRAGVMLRGTWYSTKQLDAKLDDLVKSYAAPADRFANAPALEVPEGDVLLRASYQTQFGKLMVADERLAIVRAKDGGRIIVAQAGGDPPSPKLATVRVELDAAGKLRSFTIDEDGKRATATPEGDKLHIVAGSTTKDIPLAGAEHVDANLMATMIPFADSVKPGTKMRVAGKMLSASGELSDVAYTFDRTAKGNAIPFIASGSIGDAPGTYTIDDKGFPTTITLKVGTMEFAVTRH